MTAPSIEIKDLKGLLAPKIGDDYEIIDYSTTNLTALGDNYGSTMLALTVKVQHTGTSEEKTLNLVAKMVPSNPMFFALFQVHLSFPKESLMYTTVADTINKHQIEYQVPKNLRLDTFCQCYGTRSTLTSDKNIVDNDAVLVLENLKLLGFRCGDRSKGFNKRDTEYVLPHLARFHGVPIAIKYLKSEVFEKDIMPALKKINMADGMPEHMIMEVVGFMQNVIQSTPETRDLLGVLMKQFQLGMEFASKEQNRKSHFNTISHNDFWMNNMMLKFDDDKDGAPIDIRIVDFQVSNYSSVVHDLLFFLFTSVENAVLEAELDHFLRLYFDSLYECLKANGCPLEMFTFESFLAEVNELAVIELSHILMMTKILLMDGKKLEGATEMSNDVMSNADLIGPEFYEKFKLIVLMFQKRNWLLKN